MKRHFSCKAFSLPSGDAVKTRFTLVSFPRCLFLHPAKSYAGEQHSYFPNRILKVFVVIFWIKTIHPTNSSWALSREPLKFRLNFRNGSRGTSTRGEGICHEGRQRKSILAQCAHHRAQPVALIARILLCGAHCTALFCFWPRSSFYSGNSGAGLVFSFFKYRI